MTAIQAHCSANGSEQAQGVHMACVSAVTPLASNRPMTKHRLT